MGIVFYLLAFALFAAAPSAPMALRWPARIGGLILLAFAVPGIVRLCRRLFGWMWEKIAPGLAHAGTWPAAPHVPKHAPWFEYAAAVVLILCALGPLGQMGGVMSRISLHVDEIGSVSSFTSRVPFESLTKYELVKNHVFYSFVNSITPGGGSYHPLRARMWSFLAVAGLLAILAGVSWRRGWPLEGALAFALVANGADLTENFLQARGYGFAALFGVMACWFVLRVLETPNRANHIALGGICVLGVWTIPSFAILAAPLMLGVFAARPSRAGFAMLWGSGLAGFLLYTPILTQLLKVTAGYGEEYGQSFTGLDDLLRLFQHAAPLALVKITSGILLLAVGCAALAVVVRAKKDKAMSRAVLITLASLLLFVGTCLHLGTTPLRSLVFILPSALWLGILVVRRLRDISTLTILPGILLLVPAGQLAWHSVNAARTFHFESREKWQEAAAFIRAMAAEGTPVWVNSHQNSHTPFLSPEHKVFGERPATKLNAKNFAAGEVVAYDSNFKNRERQPPEGLGPNACEIFIPVRKGFTRIYFQPPPVESLILTTPVEDGLRFELQPGMVVASIVLQSSTPMNPGEWVLSANFNPLPRKSAVQVGNAVAIDLEGIPWQELVLKSPGSPLPGDLQIWAVPRRN